MGDSLNAPATASATNMTAAAVQVVTTRGIP